MLTQSYTHESLWSIDLRDVHHENTILLHDYTQDTQCFVRSMLAQLYALFLVVTALVICSPNCTRIGRCVRYSNAHTIVHKLFFVGDTLLLS